MNVSGRWSAFALAATFVASAAEPPAETPTWQEANKQSAALIREQGPSSKAADLARLAFDLYPQQAKRYDPVSHAQLLVNLAGVRHKADGETEALREIDTGVAAITRVAGPKSPVLIAVWQEAASIAGRGTRQAGNYSDRALARAEEALGPDDPRTIELLLDVVYDRQASESLAWTLEKLADARARASKAGEGSKIVTQVELQTAKFHLEREKIPQAIEAYRRLIDRLEQRTDRDQEVFLEVAYAQLEYAYELGAEAELAKAIRERRLERLRGNDRALWPTLRKPPQYPRGAARDGTQGFVLFELEINPDGTVADAKVIESKPYGVFEAVAREAVLQWKFRPKIEGGKAVRSVGTQLVEFKLVNEDGKPIRRDSKGHEFRRGSN
jgi:TonB family protein